MLGAIIGDIVGSYYEELDFDSKDFPFWNDSCRFTDDTIMTLAIANALFLTKEDRTNLEDVAVSEMRRIGQMYPRKRWGKKFGDWLFRSTVAYRMDSYGNGSAMRVSPVAWVADTKEECIELSYKVTNYTHGHPEGIKGAEAIAVATFLARTGSSKEEIKDEIKKYYPEIEKLTVANIRSNQWYGESISSVTCQHSVPQAIVCFLESTSFEDAIRNAVSINGDSDTLACMCGSIAEAYYGVSYEMEDKALEYLDEYLKEIYYAFFLIKKKRTIKNN